MNQKLKKNKIISVSVNNKKKSFPNIKLKKKLASFEILNPATLTKIGELPLYSSEMVEEKILLAKQAQIIWSAKSLRERARELILFRKFLANNKEEMISCICNETGKTKMDALLEIFTTLEAIDYIASKGIRILSTQRRSAGLMIQKKCFVNYHPHGVVGVISPWNFPLILSVTPIMNALMAGNTVVIKPSEVTPYTTLKALEFFQRAGLTNGILQVVTGKEEAGAALVNSANTNMICFTGSTATGKIIAEACGRMLKPVVLELGGKDPMIVFKDADLRRAVRGALWGGFANSGQTCISVERVYVEKAIYNEFISLLKEENGKIKQGSKEEFPSVGSMTLPRQVEIVESHYKDAKAKGAFFVAGGKRLLSEKGLFHEPAIVIGVNHEMKIMKEETFGPEISVMEFSTEEEAIQLANNSEYGLSASVWTGDIKKAKIIAGKIQSGSVSINDVVSNYMISDLPFGGFKKSGLGRVHGPEGLRALPKCRQSLLTAGFGDSQMNYGGFLILKKYIVMFQGLLNFYLDNALVGFSKGKIMQRFFKNSLIGILILFFSFILPLISDEPDTLVLETSKVFFSPNLDDVNDTLVLQIKYSGSKTPIDWKIHIADENGKVLKVFSADLRRKRKRGFYAYMFSGDKELEPLKVEIPESVEWLGNDNNGKTLPDGRYIHQMKIFFSDKSEIKSKPVSIYLDSIAPYARVTADNRYFTPNNDKVFDQLTIKQDIMAEPMDRWSGTFFNEKNEAVKTFQWDSKTIPKVLNWDGKDDRGILQDEGIYSYQLIGEDFSQNKFTANLENIYLARTADNVDIQSNLSTFSPNGDKIKDTVIFKPISNEKNILNWELAIFKKDGKKEENIKVFSGESLPDNIEWDGKKSNGKIVSDDTYSFRLKLTAGSKNLKSPERKITVNTKEKKIYFRLSSKTFTPDGDDNADFLEIFPELENFSIKTWKLTILHNYSLNDKMKTQVIKKWKGIGQPGKRIVWDGYADNGVLIGSLSNLELHFSFRNELNELQFFKVKEFNTGILVTKKEEKLRISIPESVLKKDESSILKEVKKILSLYPGYKVQIQTHSKQPGDDKQNMKKTEARAKDIFKKMFDRDMDFERYTYQAYGEVEPLFYDEDEYKQEMNDRFDVLLTLPDLNKKK